ncbi:class I SAM-dependent methyltransferase [Nitratireductor aquimarinus]|uniref:class I SAM-dependent methyltransferase n=1 Tax=Nitratireductor aquimarinus TaxID=889300 RepID=UPI001A90A63C|nr:class I SAM-dependent methyltransferase [Nitratireductor aquimarinus]MBN8245077.1 class I SAM-dependent methyltransferase [Nitratireductor aquimarinus]MBY6133309.1 class I SAM-dependent methyltransferase [Nitratireductor aquimarinus]MCA1303614.1 class I SAM-dependent methyltransferase [Nitratireductor aquimarinus]
MSNLAETLYADPDVAQFYDYRGAARPDLAFCRKLASDAHSVLDLGCGTGELATQLADNHRFVGIDPAGAMLDIARGRRNDPLVEWIEGDARTIRLAERFDLIVLTGHTFQVFLTEADQRAVIETIAKHLKPGGRFIFDSRNPDFPGGKTRTKEETLRRFTHPKHGEVEAWNESVFDDETQILSYRNSYRVLKSGEVHTATARIRYTPMHVIAALLDDCGLTVDRWLGDWTGRPLEPASREIIPLGRKTAS